MPPNLAAPGALAALSLECDPLPVHGSRSSITAWLATLQGDDLLIIDTHRTRVVLRIDDKGRVFPHFSRNRQG